MRGKSRRYDFDLILAGEFRGSGEVAETIASHLASLAHCSLQLGLLWLRDPALPPSAPVHARIARLVREHTAVPIPPEIDDLTCRIALVYEPRLLAAAASGIPRLRADHALVVLAQPLPRSGGPAFDAGLAAAVIDGSHRQAPAVVPGLPGDPQAVLASMPRACPSPARDLPPLEPIAAWRTERNRRGGGRPVLGRMLRFDDDRLPAGRDALLAAHPAEPDLEMRFLGGEAALAGLVKPLPPAWQIFPRDAIGARRFLARLDLYVHHQDEPQRQFPRGALQAMAAGRVVTLGPGFRSVLGAGPRLSRARTRSPRPRATSRPSRASTTATSPSRTRPWPSGSAPQRAAGPAGRACPPAATGTPAGQARPARRSPSTPPTAWAWAMSPGCSRSRAGCRPTASRSSSPPATRWR